MSKIRILIIYLVIAGLIAYWSPALAMPNLVSGLSAIELGRANSASASISLTNTYPLSNEIAAAITESMSYYNADTILPEIIGQLSDPIGTAVDIFIAGNYAYVADNNNGLHIINISKLDTPYAIGFCSTPGSAWGVTVVGDYAYVADGKSGLRIINISNPTNPVEVGFYDTPDNAIDMAIVGNYTYVADGLSGLRIIDISNPTAPTEIGFYDTGDQAIDVSIAGNYAYIADLFGGLRIIDISKPTAPTEVGFYSTTGLAYRVAVAGSYAYVAFDHSSYGRLRIIDISNPIAPTETGYYDTPGGAREVAVVGNYAYVASRESGLHIIDVSNKAAPSEAGFYDTQGNALGVAVAGNNLYLAADTDGLVILRLVTDKVVSSIPSSGGSLSSTDDNTSFIFPTGAFTQTVNVTYRQLLYDENAGDLVGADHTFEITAVYSDTSGVAILAPNQTFTMTLNYSDGDKGIAVEDSLALYYWNGESWLKEGTSNVDTVINNLTAIPDHLSLWAVFGETKRVHLPLLIKN